MMYNTRTEKPSYKRVRRSWGINPKTRVKTSDKVYKRGTQKLQLRNEEHYGKV